VNSKHLNCLSVNNAAAKRRALRTIRANDSASRSVALCRSRSPSFDEAQNCRVSLRGHLCPFFSPKRHGRCTRLLGRFAFQRPLPISTHFIPPLRRKRSIASWSLKGFSRGRLSGPVTYFTVALEHFFNYHRSIMFQNVPGARSKRRWIQQL